MAAPTGMDWEWATRTGGALSKDQRRRLAARAALELSRRQRRRLAHRLTRALPERIRPTLGRRGRGKLEFEGLRLPDSALALAAEKEARESLPPFLLEHSLRTYFFGRVLAELDGARYDDELAYVASLLHDLQLGKPTPGKCFAVHGGERAHALLLGAGASPERARAVAAAIAAHLTLGVSDDLNDLGGFVSAGASADVIGARFGEFDRDWVADLLRRHPRHDFKQQVSAALRAEAKAMPDGRVRWLLDGGFLRMIAAAPFPE